MALALVARRAQVYDRPIIPSLTCSGDSLSSIGSPGQCHALQKSLRSLGRLPLPWTRGFELESSHSREPLSGRSAWDGRNCDHSVTSSNVFRDVGGPLDSGCICANFLFVYSVFIIIMWQFMSVVH